MEMAPNPYDPPFSSYAQISYRNGAQSLQKWWHFSFYDKLVGGRYLRTFFATWTFHASKIFAKGPHL